MGHNTQKARNADNGDDEHDDDDDDDDEEEEEEEYIVGRGSPRLQVTLRPMGRNDNGYWSPGVQPELAVYSERCACPSFLVFLWRCATLTHDTTNDAR